MSAGGASAQQLLEREARAWRDLTPAKYDRAVCGMLDDLGAIPDLAERVNAVLALAGATLRRDGPTLTESRARSAEHLLALFSTGLELALQLHLRLLVLLAWLRLGTAVALGPKSILVAPGLPRGVVLPDGADPAEIADPALRERAQKAAKRHRETAERWNAKQRALNHLHHLATLFLAARPGFADREDTTKELAAAMSLTPGLPFALRRLLADAAK
jgi:hypothetical protein